MYVEFKHVCKPPLTELHRFLASKSHDGEWFCSNSSGIIKKLQRINEE